MDFIALTKRIEELYKVISEIEIEAQNALASSEFFSEKKLSQEDYDFSDIYKDLLEILLPMLDLYPAILRTRYKTMAEKVYYVAVCEMIKQDYNRGMLITYRAVTGAEDINVNRYYDLLQRVSDSQGLEIKKVNGRRQFEESYILETGIPRKLTKYVIKMFRIYWRYFRNNPVNERLPIIHEYLHGNDLMDEYILDHSDAVLFESYRDYLKDFSEKAIRVFDKLDVIFSVLDEYAGEITNDNQQSISTEISKEVGFDISTVLRDSELINIYFAYLKQIPVNKFQKLLQNLPKQENVITPDGSQKTVSRLLVSNIVCGVYQIRGNKYFVVVDPNISLDDMLGFCCDRIIALANDYYAYVSRSNFYVEYNGVEVSTRMMVYKTQTRYLWFGKLQPASNAVVAGHSIMSSETSKHSVKINKYFDYEKKVSHLQLTISNIKVNDPQKPYGKLTYSINGGEKKLLAVGNGKGIYYRENIHEDIANESACFIEYWINDDKIFEDKIFLKKVYVFDKWNGTEYLSKTNNDKHSGSLLVFSREAISFDEEIVLVEQSYLDGDYHVYELRLKCPVKELVIGENSYVFERANKPTVFIKSENGDITLFESVADILIKTVNLCEKIAYRISIENAKGCWTESIEDGEFLVTDFIQDKEMLVTGKWSISLWEKQKKIDSVEFSLIPKLDIESEMKAVLEGKDVVVKITASEKCFISEVGDYDYCTNINLGPAVIDGFENEIRAREIEYYVYLDSIGISRRILFVPEVWGIRTQDEQRCEWSREKNIILNMLNPLKSKVAVCSTGSIDAFVNGKLHHFERGTNEIDYLSLIGQIKRKSEIIITDDRHAEKVILACNPDCKFSELVIDNNVEVTVKYAGPELQNVSIRTFVDGFKYAQIEKIASKSREIFHILVGEASKLKDKRVTIDVCTSKSGIPKKIFDQVIEIEDKTEIKEVIVETEEHLSIRRISDYVNVRNLLDFYYQKESSKQKIDLTSVLEWIREAK